MVVLHSLNSCKKHNFHHNIIFFILICLLYLNELYFAMIHGTLYNNIFRWMLYGMKKIMKTRRYEIMVTTAIGTEKTYNSN